MSNVAKSKTTTCQPGEICTGMSEEAFIWRIQGGEGELTGSICDGASHDQTVVWS